MKKNCYLAALAAVSIGLVPFIVSCDNPADPGGGTLSGSVGIVFPSDHARWGIDKARFEADLGAAGVEYTVLLSADSAVTEAENVATLVESGIKVLILCPVSSAGAAIAVEAAHEAGVTVIAYDRLVTQTSAVDYYVTFDNEEVGQVQGQYLVDHANGTGNPLYLYAGHQEDNNSFLFFAGAWSVLQPKIADGTFVIANSAAAVSLDDNATLTQEEIEGILGTNPVVTPVPDEYVMAVNGITTHWSYDHAKMLCVDNLQTAGASLKGDVFVLGPNDWAARGIISALESDSGITSYVITGQDAEKDSVQSILDGGQSMTVFKDVRTLSRDATAVAITILKGNVPATVVTVDNGAKEVPTVISAIVSVTADNVQEALIDTGYYQASDFTGL